MELYLQFGYGMKKNTIELADKWGGTTVILSPRDIEPKSLESWCKEFQKHNIKLLFDPQCYYPHSNHKKLDKYGYHTLVNYTNLGTDGNEETEEDLLRKVKYYNDISNTYEYILPGIIVQNLDDEWFRKNEVLIKKSKEILYDKQRIMTIALSKNSLMFNNEIVEKIIEKTEEWEVDGYYIVSEHPENKYLVDDAVWLTNLLDLCAGLKLQGKKVILGYASHQFLCCAATKIDAIASGSWLNVRMFKNKFTDEDDQIARRNIWYYYPQALSEYKLTFLDLAFNNNVLNRMKPDSNLNDDYVEVLFNGALPTSTSFKEPDAFKHYLNSLKYQIENLTKKTYKETLSAQEILLETAERNIEFNRKNGIYAQDRDFRDCVDINLAALQILNKNRGFVLEREWNNI